jgi:hypothetical protein
LRLWSLHPQYLDRQGLLALWREALLAQKVLSGHTVGYRNHPQLERFKKHPRSHEAIAVYLLAVWKEAKKRGYDFDRRKIKPGRTGRKIRVTQGQLTYEFQWLCRKLKKRSPGQYRLISSTEKICPHPFFQPVQGPVEGWERIK